MAGDHSRRQFVGMLGTAAVGLFVPRWAEAGPRGTRVISFRHLHTGERLSAEYCVDGRYLSDALTAVNHVLRDFRTNDVFPIDTGLLDLLHRLAAESGTSRPFDVISGYRSPATNAMLRQRSRGVALHSLHMTGKAIDIRLGDVPLSRLHGAALALKGGGVGYYPASDFVHVDVGRVRRW